MHVNQSTDGPSHWSKVHLPRSEIVKEVNLPFGWIFEKTVGFEHMVIGSMVLGS